MERTLSRDIASKVGQPVRIQGWLHKKRLLGGLTFINVRDRQGLVQVLIEDKDEVEKLRGLQLGTVLEVTGNAIKEERAPGGAEIHEPKLTVVVAVTDESPLEIDKPLSHKSENLDTLFDNRVIGLRNLQETKLFRIRSDMLKYIREYLSGNDFTEIQSPKLVGAAAEGGAEVFKLDYFGQEATLAQSPQLYKQMMVGVFERVYEIGPAFRAELSATTRHVSEVTMLDIELGFIEGHEDVLNCVQDMTYAVLQRTYQEHAADLKTWNAPELVLKAEFPRYSMAQIHEMYGKAMNKDMSAETDLTPEEERWICEYAKKHDGCEAVFATELPAVKMKFYHMANDNGTARSADLLFRGIEIATCPQREHRYEKLVEQMKHAGVDPADPGFSHYLLAFKHGLPPHGGCGYGIDRLVEKTVGLGNVKEAILWPRDINRLNP